jgi:hypothetical protein
MNTRQRTILGVGLAIVAAMAFFPPWRTTTEWRNPRAPAALGASSQPAGYGSIVVPPAYQPLAQERDSSGLIGRYRSTSVEIDVARFATSRTWW